MSAPGTTKHKDEKNNPEKQRNAQQDDSDVDSDIDAKNSVDDLVDRISKLDLSVKARKKITAIATNTTGARLELNNAHIGHIGGMTIGKGLGKNMTLQTLNLSGNKIGDAGGAAIGEGLGKNVTLETLNLTSSHIGYAGGTAIGEALGKNMTLQTLLLSNNQIGDVGGTAIGKGLGKNMTLQTLSLNENQIGDVGGTAFGEGIGKNITLQNLYLDTNQIGDVGGTAINEGLKKNKTLHLLMLSHNQIGDAGGRAIGEGLGKNMALQTLYLYNNQIGDVGGIAFGEGLRNNMTLQTLRLDNNQIGDVGGSAIGEGLGDNIALQTLNLDDNVIKGTAMLALAKGFRINCNIQTLSANPKGVGYTIAFTKSEIGRGQFGSVHLSSFGKNFKQEAVEKRSYSKDNREEIYETLILQGLPDHPNVVQLAAVSLRHKLLLEIHKGGSLSNFAKTNKDGVPLRQFFLYSLGMCEAIQHLHKHGLLHRDIALRNYVLTEDLQMPVLVDFGLSWPIGEEKEVPIRPDEKMPFRQCAPEVFTTLHYSKACDIWQLGLALWQLAHCGRQPFFQFANSNQLSHFLTNKMAQEKATLSLPFKKYGSLVFVKTIKAIVVFSCPYEPAERPSAAELFQKIVSLQESAGAQLEEEKEISPYKPDDEAVDAGLKIYNYTDYELLGPEGQSDYRNLESDMEAVYDKLEEFLDVDLEDGVAHEYVDLG